MGALKLCRGCSKEKPLDAFAKRKRASDGLQSRCRVCRAAQCADWYAANRAAQLEANTRWRDANRGAFNEWLAARRARRTAAVPPWADRAKMRAIYEEANRRREAGELVEVDHVVPITSPLVCGLHWEGNLEIVPANDNASKGNRWWPDMP